MRGRADWRAGGAGEVDPRPRALPDPAGRDPRPRRLRRGPRLTGRTRGKMEKPRAWSIAGSVPGMDRWQDRGPARPSARRREGRRQRGALASRSRGTGTGRPRRPRPRRREPRSARANARPRARSAARARPGPTAPARGAAARHPLARARGPRRRAASAASQSPRPRATKPSTWSAVIRVVMPPRPSASACSATEDRLVPAAGRPQHVGQVRGHVVAVVPELDSLREGRCPRGASARARAYSTRTEAHDPSIR